MFHQIEGLVIDETTHMGHLKWVLEEFCKAFFEVDQVKMRFRASHFPFTEPSMEVDIGAEAIGKPGQWLEILGSGMVHPNVIRNCGLDPDKYQGFAFGMGLDRIDDAEIRHPGSARVLCRRLEVAQPLRLLDARRADAGRRIVELNVKHFRMRQVRVAERPRAVHCAATPPCSIAAGQRIRHGYVTSKRHGARSISTPTRFAVLKEHR
jgi:hypothetical protein